MKTEWRTAVAKGPVLGPYEVVLQTHVLKYKAFFDTLADNATVDVASEKVNAMVCSLRNYIKQHRPHLRVRSISNFKTGTGRIWLEERKKKMKQDKGEVRLRRSKLNINGVELVAPRLARDVQTRDGVVYTLAPGNTGSEARTLSGSTLVFTHESDRDAMRSALLG